MTDLKALVKAAEAQGWRYVRRTKHAQLYAPDGKTIVTLALTASDYRSARNSISIMKRAGFIW